MADQTVPEGLSPCTFTAEPVAAVFMCLSLQGKVLSISKTITPLTGHTVDEHLQLGPLSCVHEEDLTACQNFIASAVQVDFPVRFVFRLMHTSGSYRWVEATCDTVRDGSGEPVELLVLLREVTPPSEVNLSLLESEQLSRQIVNGTLEGIGVLDLELRYIAWNPLMETLSGVKEEDILGRTPLEVFPFLKEMGIYDLILRARNGEIVSTPDVEYAPPTDSRSYWSSGRMGPLRNSNGQIVGVIVTFMTSVIANRPNLPLAQARNG